MGNTTCATTARREWLHRSLRLHTMLSFWKNQPMHDNFNCKCEKPQNNKLEDNYMLSSPTTYVNKCVEKWVVVTGDHVITAECRIARKFREEHFFNKGSVQRRKWGHLFFGEFRLGWQQSRGRTPIWNRQGCSSEILNLTPKGDQSGRGLSKFWPLKETP